MDGTVLEMRIGHYRCQQAVYYAICKYLNRRTDLLQRIPVARQEWPKGQLALAEGDPYDFDTLLAIHATGPMHQIDYKFAEQVVYRALRCPACMEAGKCFSCKCSTPGVFMAPHKHCGEGMWPQMIDHWPDYRIEKQIKITLT